MEITTAQIQGGRPYQEDRYSVIIDKPYVLVSVFDGHGGVRCVECIRDIIPVFSKYWFRRGETPKETLRQIYAEIKEMTQFHTEGSTASSVLITPEEVVFAVLGDSPIQALTVHGPVTMPEHNVRTNSIERDAAIARGGIFTPNGYIYNPKYQRGLMMARAFGDWEMEGILNRNPQIASMKRGEVSSILVGSDGLTDPGHESVPFLLKEGVTAQDLIEIAGYGYPDDNVTAVVVHLDKHDNK